MTRLVLALALTAALAAGTADGREGNAALSSGDLDAAADAYVAGLARDGVPRAVGARLWHNLALVRLAQRRAPEADSALARALPLADDAAVRAVVAYDLGVARLATQDGEGAVAALRRALLLRPDWPAARRNLEIAIRLRDDGPPPPPEPSAFAEAAKAESDSLVAEGRYTEALGTMRDALARDSSVAAFQEYIGRLDGVVQIDTADVLPAPAPAP